MAAVGGGGLDIEGFIAGLVLNALWRHRVLNVEREGRKFRA